MEVQDETEQDPKLEIPLALNDAEVNDTNPAINGMLPSAAPVEEEQKQPSEASSVDGADQNNSLAGAVKIVPEPDQVEPCKDESSDGFSAPETSGHSQVIARNGSNPSQNQQQEEPDQPEDDVLQEENERLDKLNLVYKDRDELLEKPKVNSNSHNLLYLQVNLSPIQRNIPILSYSIYDVFNLSSFVTLIKLGL